MTSSRLIFLMFFFPPQQPSFKHQRRAITPALTVAQIALRLRNHLCDVYQRRRSLATTNEARECVFLVCVRFSEGSAPGFNQKHEFVGFYTNFTVLHLPALLPTCTGNYKRWNTKVYEIYRITACTEYWRCTAYQNVWNAKAWGMPTCKE